MPFEHLADQGLDLVMHHPRTAVACALAAALISWFVTRTRPSI
jgi:hypothetical protein